MVSTWPDEIGVLAEKIAKTVACRYRRYFGLYPEYSACDLLQEGLRGCVEAWPGYDPDRGGTVSTFFYRVSANKIATLLRHLRTRGSHQSKDEPDETAPPLPDSWLDARVGPAEGQSVPQWARSIYLAAKRKGLPRRYRSGRRFYKPHQSLACAVVRRYLHASYRGMVLILSQSQELRRALYFFRSPSPQWFFNSEIMLKKVVTENNTVNCGGNIVKLKKALACE